MCAIPLFSCVRPASPETPFLSFCSRSLEQLSYHTFMVAEPDLSGSRSYFQIQGHFARWTGRRSPLPSMTSDGVARSKDGVPQWNGDPSLFQAYEEESLLWVETQAYLVGPTTSDMCVCRS